MTKAVDVVVEQLREAELYDPDVDGAAERLELLRFNLEQGVTVDELVAAERLGRLHYVGGDPHIRPDGVSLTLAELAERPGVDEAEVARIWRSAGLVDPDCGAITLSEADVEVIDVVRAGGAVFDEKVTLHDRTLREAAWVSGTTSRPRGWRRRAACRWPPLRRRAGTPAPPQ